MGLWQEIQHHAREFVQHYGVAAYGVTGFGLILRTAIPPGAFVPGGTMILTMGAVAAFWPPAWCVTAVLFLALCSAVGSVLGYEIARHFLHPDRNGPGWLRPRQDVMDRAMRTYQKLGGFATAFAVSQPWLCPISPWIAVATSLSRRRYHAGSAIGAILWISIVFMLGYFPARLASSS